MEENEHEINDNLEPQHQQEIDERMDNYYDTGDYQYNDDYQLNQEPENSTPDPTLLSYPTESKE